MTVTWIFMWLVALAVCVLLVPIQDAPNEGRYEGHLGLGAGHGLSEREQQGHVAVDAVFLLQLSATANQPNAHNISEETDKDEKTSNNELHKKATSRSSFSSRLLHSKSKKRRDRRSFLPAASRLYNGSIKSFPLTA